MEWLWHSAIAMPQTNVYAGMLFHKKHIIWDIAWSMCELQGLDENFWKMEKRTKKNFSASTKQSSK